ncbi:MAG: holo-ACP synthase [Nitrospiraceae bacterium]|nr:holo-ACP synthase [Nitrospiraceae bacterium]
MVLGLGIDLVHIPRIEKAFDRWGEKFLFRVFSQEECNYCLRHKRPAQTLAIRFAAKEACSKALGTGMRSGVAWRQMTVSHEPSGRPILHLSGPALKRAKALGAKSWHVSLSHEEEYATAVVIMSD